ncbi:CmcJ/NvfI family oxidoreductase [Acidithiobacillus sp. IBUN Pt1247-S3]|uniref:CmcJ/NvfI family oxidoreductase n=1 Tax=Acidithiobacillus sp. IBUN Pt1247-S3 TaxID=3166642 RepID=UPI0034E4F044
MRARVRGYLPEDFSAPEYQSSSDNFHCSEMLAYDWNVRDARRDLLAASPQQVLKRLGFTLMTGNHVNETQADFRDRAYADACAAVQSLFPNDRNELFADPRYITVRRSSEGQVVPCLHADYSRSAEEYWRTLACFTSIENADTWKRGFARAEVQSYQVFNVWRLLQPDYEDYMPLGLVGRDSVHQEDIVLGRENLPGSPDGQASTFLRLRYSSRHDWSYFSRMQDNELIVFQSFELSKDGTTTAQPGCFHAALDNSAASIAQASRVSCEYRIGVYIFA